MILSCSLLSGTGFKLSPTNCLLYTKSISIFTGLIVMYAFFQKTDIAAAFLPVIPSLIYHISFSPGLQRGQWVVMMRRPSLSANGSGLLAPFTWDVWLLTILSLLVVGPIIYLLVLVKVRLCPGQPHNEKYPLPSCVWFVYGAMLKQGSLLNPVSGKRRLLLICFTCTCCTCIC